MSRTPPPRVLTDPRAIRALAHPARLAVLDALADGAELTATECAERAGASPSAMSYHLRALEKWGFVERAAASGDGRERPWRSVPGGWRIEASSDRAANAAQSAVVATVLDRLAGELARWTEVETSQPKSWRDVAALETSALWLTAEEAAQMQRLVEDFVDARRGRTGADHPPGARRVRVARLVVPLQVADS